MTTDGTHSAFETVFLHELEVAPAMLLVKTVRAYRIVTSKQLFICIYIVKYY